jgi:hypothetical protein
MAENDIPKTSRIGYKQMSDQRKKMKSISPVRRLLSPLVACCLLLVAVPAFSAPDQDPFNSALSAAKAWLGLIDQGHYDESYDAGGAALHDQLPDRKTWSSSLKIMRSAWGDILDRKPTQHLYQPNGFSTLPGECMVIAFETDTKKQSTVTEMVIMRYEDGQWRGAGYTMGSKPGAQPDMAPAAVSTTTQETVPTGQLPGQKGK